MDDITLEIAIQLIADKKAKGPVRKKNTGIKIK
jgi:topoisomerase IA-like protein